MTTGSTGWWGLPKKGLEPLVQMLISFRRAIDEDKRGCEAVRAEIDRFIELLFRQSKAYRLALEPYNRRSEVIGGHDPEVILSRAIDKYIHGIEDGSEGTNTDGENARDRKNAKDRTHARRRPTASGGGKK